MADEADSARESEALSTQIALNAQLQRHDFSRESLYRCIECDKKIPEERREIGGIVRCVDCQHIDDEERKKWAR